MVTRPPFAEKEFYHIFNRGTEKRLVFEDLYDYWRFLKLLFVCNNTKPFNLKYIDNPFVVDRQSPLVAIGAYCLMPNHFHILLTPLQEKGVARFMQKLITGYTMYFNTKNSRSGALFQGRYKVRHATDDRYLKYLFSYIHLNPVRSNIASQKNILSSLDAYPFSSHHEYCYPANERIQKAIVSKESFPYYFDSETAYVNELNDWIHYTEVEPQY